MFQVHTIGGEVKTEEQKETYPPVLIAMHDTDLQVQRRSLKEHFMICNVVLSNNFK